MLIKNEIPRCPLCGKIYSVKLIPKLRNKMWYVCHTCKICLKTDDPLIGVDVPLEDDEDELACVNCRAKMRWFYRSDGYIKGVCPKCKCEVESSRVDDAAEHEYAIRKLFAR